MGDEPERRGNKLGYKAEAGRKGRRDKIQGNRKVGTRERGESR